MGKKKINHILFDTNVLFRFMEGDESTKSILYRIGKEASFYWLTENLCYKLLVSN